MFNMFLFTGFCLEDKFFSAKRDVLSSDEDRRHQTRVFYCFFQYFRFSLKYIHK